ncbi:hypothetical protein H5410_047512 [Solanum commersonii]|uniref:NB-ARC domain-containing protein n=1 Tax=Solanum commersonii TaxID=4109 RepID=A0A9J5XIW3_SOLCO|nr:hypothetical protein H5410_047512 [Solanum commersonii]
MGIEFLLVFLDADVSNHVINEKELSSLSSIFRDVAKYNAFLHIFCSLPTISKEIKQINAQVTEMLSSDVALKPFYVITLFKHLPTRHSNPVIDEEIVGCGNDIEKMIQYLIKAWCIISQTYNRRTLLQESFSQVTGYKDKRDKDDILTNMLRKSLVGKRYIIVLDDMWDCMAWDDLRLYFPDIGNRSRILVTTRLEKVGKQVKYHTDPYFRSSQQKRVANCCRKICFKRKIARLNYKM